ncbi:MAG: tRNA pseudouridine(54/55) synthase Pus10 [Thermoplasmata archaeon]
MSAPSLPFEISVEVREVARRAASEGLCPECFGRLFGRLGRGLTNPERAHRLEAELPELVLSAPTDCRMCRGAFERIPLWVERIVRSAEGIEFTRFTCGSRWEPEDLAREEELGRRVGTEWAENVRGAFNRELGKQVERATGAAGGTERPDVVFLADLPVGRATITIQPLYLRGRYRKLDRTLPQTRWPCRACSGRGCDVCHGTGKTYSESVEELVAAPAIRMTGAEGTRFHGMGREDIDARMLGTGRPFVLELLRPKTRVLAIDRLSKEIPESSGGRVEVVDLRMAEPTDVLRVKEASPQKTYRVSILGEVPEAKVKEALSLALARTIAQRTPTRVAHRRSDRVRPRRIVGAELAEWGAGRFTVELRTEAGTYVKEWVEGDGGRTEPNLAGLVGVPLKVESLDVLEVHDL